MSEENLLRAILQDAESAARRLVYADWLEEHGEPERAEFIRVQCSLNELPEGDPARPTLDARWLELLLVAFKEAWISYLHLALTWNHLMMLFRWRLAEAIAWCRDRDACSLRTPEPEPASLLGWFAPSAGGKDVWQHPSLADRERAVNAVASRRASLLVARQQYPREPATDCAGGRLVLFDPDDTLSDGAAETESAFFDADNVPAWDAWVWYARDVSGRSALRSYVVAWVPPDLVEQVDGAIEVNPEECIRWASDVDTVLCRKLRAAGLLA